MWRAVPAVLVLAMLAVPGTVAAEPAPNVTARIGARLWPDGGRLDGKIALDITNDTPEPLSSIPLWLYPNRFADPERGIDARTANWLYPYGASPGSMAVGAASWNGKPLPPSALRREAMPAGGSPAGLADVVLMVRLPSPLAPGGTGTLDLGFSVEIPQRRGRFGRSGGTVTLGGDWFPRPFADLSGARPGLPPRRIRARLDLALPADRGAVIADRVFPLEPSARTLAVSDLEGEALPVVVLDRMEVTTRTLPWGTAVHVGREPGPRPPKWKDARGDDTAGLPRGLPVLGDIDYASRALDVAARTAAVLRELAPKCPLPRRLVLVEVPARDRLAQSGPGMVLVSDRAWRVVKLEAALVFHDIYLARIVAAELAGPAVAAHNDGADRWLAAEIAAAGVAARYSERVLGEKKSVRELLGFASFLPLIDTLLYAPQIPFREVYSTATEEEDPWRDAPWHFMNRLAGGRRIHAKLEDRLGVEETDRLAAAILSGEGGLVPLLRERLGEDTAAFLARWSGPYPSVNYRIAGVRDENLADGRVRHVVEVARDGEPIREPVTVRIEDRDDAIADEVWSGEGDPGEVRWTSGAPVKRVRVDPEQRLQEDPALGDKHPLGDNTVPLPWRLPLLTRFVLWGDVLSGEPHVDVSMAMRREYDLTNSIHLNGAYTPRKGGGSVSFLRHFGPKRTLNARTWHAGPILGAMRYNETERAGPDIPEESLVAATMGTVGVMLGRDDRVYFWDPTGGLAFVAAAEYSVGRGDDGRTLHVGSASARLFQILTAAIGHSFALYGGATGVIGDPVAADLATLSNRQVLRGFDLDETYGRLGFYGVAEYRHTLIDLSWLPKILLVRLDRLQGALFVGAGTISRPNGYDGLFSAERLFTEAGYGFRIHTFSFGLTQNLLALDLGVPLTPLDRTYEVAEADGTLVRRDRAPFKLVFGITQTY
jgi:hypothetical protein